MENKLKAIIEKDTRFPRKFKKRAKKEIEESVAIKSKFIRLIKWNKEEKSMEFTIIE